MRTSETAELTMSSRAPRRKGTPCGDKGYGLDDKYRCLGRTWAACLENSDAGDCYYLKSHDDCA